MLHKCYLAIAESDDLALLANCSGSPEIIGAEFDLLFD